MRQAHLDKLSKAERNMVDKAMFDHMNMIAHIGGKMSQIKSVFRQEGITHISGMGLDQRWDEESKEAYQVPFVQNGPLSAFTFLGGQFIVIGSN